MTPRPCSIEGCSNPHHARGWCTTHYTRWRLYGDPFYVTPATERGAAVRLGYRHPMDAWERRRVSQFLDQGMSYRQIQRSTGVGFMTVFRFARSRKSLQSRSGSV